MGNGGWLEQKKKMKTSKWISFHLFHSSTEYFGYGKYSILGSSTWKSKYQHDMPCRRVSSTKNHLETVCYLLLFFFRWLFIIVHGYFKAFHSIHFNFYFYCFVQFRLDLPIEYSFLDIFFFFFHLTKIKRDSKRNILKKASIRIHNINEISNIFFRFHFSYFK